jgi:hypothetical protein
MPESSCMSRAKLVALRPAPPYSVGIVAPKSPSSLRPASTRSGMAASRSMAAGSISRRANSRTLSRMSAVLSRASRPNSGYGKIISSGMAP